MAALLTWPTYVLWLFHNGMAEPAVCPVFEQHCLHLKTPEIQRSVVGLLVAEMGLVSAVFEYLWGCALKIGHFTDLRVLWGEGSFKHMSREWQHCRERPRRPELDAVAWKDNEGWHLNRPSFLRLPLDAHLSLCCYSSLANIALIEVRVSLPWLMPFMLARETQLVWEDIQFIVSLLKSFNSLLKVSSSIHLQQC